MPKPKFKIEFEPGWADDLLDDDMTQEDIDALIDGINQLIATGEIFESATPFEELNPEEQAEIETMFAAKHIHTRH